MNYFELSNFIDLKLNYNETDAKAFKGLSTDTKSLGTNIEKNKRYLILSLIQILT